MESSATRLADLQLIVVGEGDGALAAALEGEGAEVSVAALHELGRHAGAHLVLVGKAAVDGGKHALANAPAGAAATVVLPRGAAAARIAAIALGLRVVEPAEPAQLARAILERLASPPDRALGWTELGPLLDAVAARVALRLGADQSRGLQLRLGDAGEVADLIERYAVELAALSHETRAPDSLGPQVAVDELSWDDDPQTQRLEDEEVARWRRLSAREPSPKMIRGLAKAHADDGAEWAKGVPRSDIVPAETSPGRLPAPGRLPSGVIPGVIGDDGPATKPAMFPLPLVQRIDHDIEETAPRPAITDEDLSEPEEDLVDADLAGASDETLIRDAEPLPALPPIAELPPSERATVPERLPLPAAPPSREATPPPSSITASSRPSKLPLVFGLGVIALGALAVLVGVGLFAFAGTESIGAVATASPARPPAALEQATEGVAPVAEVVVEAAPPEPPAARAPVVEAPPIAAPIAAPEPLDEDALRARSDALVADGQAAEREGDWAAARAAYQGAVEVYDGNPHAHAGLARERLQMQDADSALFHARRAASLRRRRAEYQVLLGRAHRLAGDAAAARAAFDRALELDPEDREALRALSP